MPFRCPVCAGELGIEDGYCGNCDDVFGLDRCQGPKCEGEPLAPRDLSRFVGIEKGREELDAPAPVLAPYLLPVWVSHATLGRDDSGRILWAEQVAFLNEHDVTDVDERRFWQELWQTITAAELLNRTVRAERAAEPNK